MDLSDASIVATALAIAMGLVKISEKAITAALRRRNSNGNGRQCNHPEMDRLVDISKDQLAVLRGLEQGLVQGVTNIRSDLRMAALEQNHLQKSVEAIHTRIDKTLDKTGT